MSQIQEVVKCYLFLIFTYILWTHPFRSKPVIKTIFLILVPDAKTSSGPIPEVKKSDQLLGKYYCILGSIWAKWGVGKQVWFVPKTARRFGVAAERLLHLNLEIVFSALKLPQNCYIMNINSDFPTHHIYPVWKTILTIWQNRKARKLQKSQFPKCLVNRKKIGSSV